MPIPWDKEYSGPGCADPTKTRVARQKELLALVRTASGREVIEYYFGKYTGVSQLACPPAGLLMIQSLLGHEYPGG
jgi:hypothetical protein